MGITKQQKAMVAVLLSGAVLVVLNATLLSPALPSIMVDTGVDATTVQWLTSAYSLVEAVVIPLNAFLVGRFSTRKLFLGGIAWFAGASVLAACAPNFGIILLARVMMAMATGIVMPMVFTLILLIFPREMRGSAMGIVGLVISFAPAIGPSLSGVVVDSIGWRALFVIVAVLAAVVVLVASFSLKNFTNFERTTFDAPSVALLACGMLGLLYGISSMTSAVNKLPNIALVICGIVLLVLFARRQTTLEVPILRVETLKSRKFRTAVILIALLQAALIGSEVVLPIYVQQIRGFNATTSGLLMLPGAVVGAICGVLAGRIYDKHGVRKLALFGAVLILVGAVGVTSFSYNMHIIMITVVYTTMAIGIQFLSTPLNTWGMNSLPNSMVQHANPISATMNQVGISLGTAIIVSLTALGGMFAPAGADALTVQMSGVHVAFCGMATILTIVAIGIMVFVRDRKEQNPTMAAYPTVAQSKDIVPSGTAGVDRPFLVADVMNPKANTVPTTATVREAIDAMRATETSGVPVVDEAGHAVAFLSDGDVMKYLSRQTGTYTDGMNYFQLTEDEDFWSRLADLLELNVMRIATPRVISIDAHDDAEDAFKLLSEQRIKKVPVLYKDKVVGTLSRRNILNSMVTAEQILSESQSTSKDEKNAGAEAPHTDVPSTKQQA
ncbi:MAG: MDR family MFS transporter [Eggerthellaceae bacterium]|jgi:DHA2 family multidrug resistance protein-like MFS transporter